MPDQQMGGEVVTLGNLTANQGQVAAIAGRIVLLGTVSGLALAFWIALVGPPVLTRLQPVRPAELPGLWAEPRGAQLSIRPDGTVAALRVPLRLRPTNRVTVVGSWHYTPSEAAGLLRLTLPGAGDRQLLAQRSWRGRPHLWLWYGTLRGAKAVVFDRRAGTTRAVSTAPMAAPWSARELDLAGTVSASPSLAGSPRPDQLAAPPARRGSECPRS